MRRLKMNSSIKIMMVILTGLFVFPGVVPAEERLSVTAGIANMRSGPGTKYDVLWQVEKYHPVRVLEKQGEWYKIKDFENDVAWLHNSLLDRTTSVITIKNKCNVRSKADKGSTILFTVEKGVPFKVLKRKDDWIKIEHADGDIGWIYNTLVW